MKMSMRAIADVSMRLDDAACLTSDQGRKANSLFLEKVKMVIWDTVSEKVQRCLDRDFPRRESQLVSSAPLSVPDEAQTKKKKKNKKKKKKKQKSTAIRKRKETTAEVDREGWGGAPPSLLFPPFFGKKPMGKKGERLSLERRQSPCVSRRRECPMLKSFEP